MLLWRISNYADLLGIGGTQASARWHTAGQPVVYLAETPSAALLEVLMHLEIDDSHQPEDYQLLKIEVPDELSFQQTPRSALSETWKEDEIQTQAIGDQWLDQAESALLKVPSAIAPETWNWLLNPRHVDASQLKIVQAEQHLYDQRLFKV